MTLIKKILFILDRNQKIKLFRLFLMILIGAFLEMLGVTILSPLFTVAMDPSILNKKDSWAFQIRNLWGEVTPKKLILCLILVIVIIYIFKNLFLCFMYGKQYRFIAFNQKSLATKLLRAYIKRPYIFFASKNSAELIRSVNTDSAQFFVVVQNILQLLTDGTICVVLGVALFFQNFYIMSILTILLSICIIPFVLIFRKYSLKLGKNNQVQLAKMIQWLNQLFGGIKEVKVLGREEFFVDSYDRHFASYADGVSKNQLMGQMPKFTIETVCIVGVLLALALSVIGGADLATFVPHLSVFALAAFRLLPATNRITGNINTILFFKPSVDLIYNDISSIKKLQEEIKDNGGEKRELKFRESIELRNICFHYPNAEDNVLQNINLLIPKGKSIALIGSSGAGKTTLADIILGLLSPDSGGILVDGIDIISNRNAWKWKIGYIPQFIYLSDASIKKNIAFGIPDEDIDDEQVWRAVEEAQLKSFILDLEDGINTCVGERGVRLSGGQRQRIGIARALYLDPEILVLDEATSALDTSTEQAVMEAIYKLHGVKTLIIIAHRLSTIEKCDMVFEITGK